MAELLSINGSLESTDDLSGNLSVTGTTNLAALTASTTTINGGLTVTGTTSVRALTSTASTVNGNLTVTGTTSISGLTTSTATVNGNLTVTGTTSVRTLTSTASTVNGNLTVTGNTNTGALTASTLYVTSVGSGSSINYLGLDASGNTVSGATRTAALSWSNTGTGINTYQNPTATGGNLVGSATFTNSTLGVRLVNTATQNGTVWWNLSSSGSTRAFDFTRDFEATFMTYFDGTVNSASNGDGHYFNFGGNGGSSSGYAINDNSLCFLYDPYNTVMATQGFINGVQVTQSPIVQSIDIQQKWVTWTVKVQRNFRTGVRQATFMMNNITQCIVNVTSWNPSGTIVTVGAWTGSAFCPHYVYAVELDYI